MRISDALTEKLLEKSGKADKIKALREQDKTKKKSLQDLAVRENIITEKELTELYAEEIDVPFVELSPREIKKQDLQLIPARVAAKYRAIVYEVDKDGNKLLAMEDPDDIQAISFLQKHLGTNDVRIHIATSTQIQAALEQYRGNMAGELTKIITTEDTDEVSEEVNEEDVAEDSPIAQTVNIIIDYAIKSGASDIHIEPREGHVVIRYRIDGILREANKLPRKVLAALVSRIKILSNLKIDEHRAPQDGRFKIKVADQGFALRVSTLPVADGEKVVMRILNESSKAATLEELGFWGKAMETLQNAIVQPHGMILVTGPTGSGKSTTLFSVLSMLNTPSVNISTVEDPVEYRIPGVNQTQVNPQAGMTFQSGLRALLRQDPNIIMVGEIRDGETAELGVQAALTGHLVFSTLHTNNAATCLPRLLDMGIEPFLIASTVRVVIGQRLVRRLCPECRESYKPDENQMKHIEKIFHLESSAMYKQINELEQAAITGNIGTQHKSSADPGTTPNGIERLWKAHAEGCDACNHTGYKGRIGIYEVLGNSEKVQNLIVSNGTSESIQNVAIEGGMLTMHVDGFVKAVRGETTIEEILRVTAED